ncbi:hypothetical protein [Bradyrhizobium sp. WD16]|uniref:hypothetical protein n=1 Tax=Bradyrhizobium sp. WD16 TaxID=1521768 RepID=UPI0020A2B7AD|nr:hypothetical protein [Bradyrhizobium sp. WD16]
MLLAMIASGVTREEFIGTVTRSGFDVNQAEERRPAPMNNHGVSRADRCRGMAFCLALVPELNRSLAEWFHDRLHVTCPKDRVMTSARGVKPTKVKV